MIQRLDRNRAVIKINAELLGLHDRFIAQRQKKAKGTTVLMMDGKPRDTISHPE